MSERVVVCASGFARGIIFQGQIQGYFQGQVQGQSQGQGQSLGQGHLQGQRQSLGEGHGQRGQDQCLHLGLYMYLPLASPEDCLLTAPLAPSTGLIR